MLYHLLYPLHVDYSFFNVFRYITFRTIYASITALLLCFILGPWLIRELGSHQIGQAIRRDGPESHLTKEGTPTMGGLLIVLAVVIPTLLWANLTNSYIWIAVFVTVGFGAVGFLDDYKKVIRKDSKGLSARWKFLLQILLAGVAAVLIYMDIGINDRVGIPFFKRLNPSLGVFYIPFIILVIVGASNAVNLTDGLDGLAIGPSIVAAGTYMLFAYLTGHVKIANYLQILYVPGAGELTIFCGAMAGAGIGFLWYNTYPAQVFMGDTGSLSIGAALGVVAVMVKHEILLLLVGGVFVIEALSVIFQVFSYKTTRKRIFRMAPVHHHFELKGWAEPKIIVRFWIISIILALLAISTLKIR
ncbi:MAG: phospho-N-acetylmuramoyl-pentapeptide-transferase [Deltaproteobacteria bacterium GWC2_65_14]|nr:MAG: phospho-N-acetylmuramoyl-pentapeptide-transferase [Deltaproteobacteria bacterium GWC2_65_14]